MAFEQIEYEVRQGVATVTLNRPDKLNAWTQVMEAEVRAAMAQAEGDEAVRVIVLTGAGRGFCAGADMSALSGLTASANEPASARVRAMFARTTPPPRDGVPLDFQQRYSYFLGIPKPVVAAVHGPAAGLGMVIALYCDLRLASGKARFSTAFSKRGLIAEYGISWTLTRLVGRAKALDLLYSSRAVDAPEALRMGLVDRVLPEEGFPGAVQAYAAELAATVSPRSLAVIKRQVYAAETQTLAEAAGAANEEMFRSFDSQDFKEGVAHFLEKRAPAFTGR